MLTSQIKSRSLLGRKIKYLLSPVAEPNSAASRMFVAYFGLLTGITYIASLKSKEFDDPNNLIIVNAADLSVLKTPPSCSLVVFMTDIIRMDSIVKMMCRISLIVTTSALQSRIMSSVLSIDCFTALEPIDPFYELVSTHCTDYRTDTAKVLFFGYSNSLERTSSHLAPFLDKIDLRFETLVFSESIPPSFRGCKRCRFLEFPKIREQIGLGFNYVVLSDIPVDLSVSTLAKSDNKLISSIRMGFLPLIARGSRYLYWLPDDYPYTFSNPLELLKLINQKLDVKNDYLYFYSKLTGIPIQYEKAHLANVMDFALVLDRLDPVFAVNSLYPLKSWPGEFSYGLKDSFHVLRKSFSQTLRNRFIRLWRFFVGTKL